MLSQFMDGLPEEAIRVLRDHDARRPTPRSASAGAYDPDGLFEAAAHRP
jgi:hypothetical protein